MAYIIFLSPTFKSEKGWQLIQQHWQWRFSWQHRKDPKRHLTRQDLRGFLVENGKWIKARNSLTGMYLQKWANLIGPDGIVFNCFTLLSFFRRFFLIAPSSHHVATTATIYRAGHGSEKKHHFYIQPKSGKSNSRVLAAEHPRGNILKTVPEDLWFLFPSVFFTKFGPFFHPDEPPGIT